MLESFRNDFVCLWKSLPQKPLFFGLLAGWLGLFHFLGNSTFGYIETPSLFGWMNYVYSTSEDDGHCTLIPLVVLALFWWKREELMRVEKRAWWPALLLVMAGLVLHMAGFLVQQGRVSILGFFLGLYGLMGLAWGRQFLKASFFPYFLFIFCVPLGTMADSLTLPLRSMVSVIAAGFSQWVLGIEVIRVGTQLFDPLRTFQYDVAAACSGIRSLTVLLALTTIFGFTTFKTGWKQALMVFIAFPLAVVGNVVRITGVIVVAEAFGQEAGMKFHDAAGFVTFAIAIVCVMILATVLREEPPEKPPGNPPGGPPGEAPERECGPNFPAAVRAGSEGARS
jgi:exosortase